MRFSRVLYLESYCVWYLNNDDVNSWRRFWALLILIGRGVGGMGWEWVWRWAEDGLRAQRVWNVLQEWTWYAICSRVNYSSKAFSVCSILTYSQQVHLMILQYLSSIIYNYSTSTQKSNIFSLAELTQLSDSNLFMSIKWVKLLISIFSSWKILRRLFLLSSV